MGDLKLLKPRPAQDREKILKQARRWIDKAQEEGSPELTGLAIVSVQADGAVGVMYETAEHYWELIGALQVAIGTMVEDTSGTPVDPDG
jgi:hypothetical protein